LLGPNGKTEIKNALIAKVMNKKNYHHQKKSYNRIKFSSFHSYNNFVIFLHKKTIYLFLQRKNRKIQWQGMRESNSQQWFWSV